MDKCARLKVLGGMISDPPTPAREACSKHLHTNLGDPESYEGLAEAASELAVIVSRAVLGAVRPLAYTSGATETNLLALYYWRERGKTRVVAPETAHYSVWKAAKILGLKSYKINNIINKKISEKDIIVLTVGTTEEGLIDPIAEAAMAAREEGAVIHVDAAYAGLIMRWLPQPVRVRLEMPIATIAVDLHKLGEAPMPLGVMLASDESIIESLYFDAPYIPSGRQFGMLGSRPGCPIFAALESFRFLETFFGSLRNMAKALMDAARQIIDETSMHGYWVPTFRTPIICLMHDNMQKIRKYFYKNNIKIYTCRRGNGIRLAIMPHHVYDGWIDCIVRMLKDAAAH